MKKFFFLLFIANIALLSSCGENATNNKQTKEVTIGVLLSKTGGGKSLGESAEAALLLALEEVNENLAAQKADFKIKLQIEDSQTNPDVALQKMQEFHAKGIRLVIGPQVSAEGEKILPYANQNKMLLLSPTSVAISLAIPNDNLYRLTPSDHTQALAMGAYLASLGKKHLIGLIRNDVWGTDLQASLKESLMNDYANVTRFHRNLVYEPTQLDFNELLTQANVFTADAADIDGTFENVGIYLASFAEGSEILKQAENYANLMKPVWFGASAFAQNKTIETDLDAGRIAAQAKIACPIYGFNDAAKSIWEPLLKDIESKIGRSADIYSICAYDALWLAAHIYYKTSADANSDALIPALKSAVADYQGATGKIEFDSAGDRDKADYDFWGVYESAGKYHWRKVAKFITSTKQVIHY